MSKYQQDDCRLAELKTGHTKVWKSFFDDHSEPFRQFVMKYGNVSYDRAFDLYQESIIILHRNVVEGKLSAPLRASLQTYLFGIAKNLCRRNTASKLSFPDNLPDLPQSPIEDQETASHRADVVRRLLLRIGEKCRQFLTLVFLEEEEQEKVMEIMNIPTAEAFRKRKHDCLKKMRELVGS